MDNDDAQVGRILNRREILFLLGGAGALVTVGAGCSGSNDKSSATGSPSTPAQAGAATSSAGVAANSSASASATKLPTCVVSPELSEGPYFVEQKLNRSDIRSDPASGATSAGVPLLLAFKVSGVTGAGCSALAAAVVDVWHCDAAGVYSDATDRSFNTKGKQFLRGSQITDSAGQVKFTTIFPGWYQGRAVHIHFKVRAANSAGKSYEFTSQLFFEEAQIDEIFANAPYIAKGQGRTKNAADGIFNQGGKTLTLPLTKSGNGYAGTFEIGVNLACRHDRCQRRPSGLSPPLRGTS
ncbi:MAG: intradiol ring-cleavage dioxygenase [Tepidiformaceae bacterium]